MVKKKQITDKKRDRLEDIDEFYEQLSEKKYRPLKKVKRDRPPHKKWEG